MWGGRQRDVHRRGATIEDVLQLTLDLTDMDAYEPVSAALEAFFEDPYPARTTAGVCAFLGGAAVRVDAVVAIEYGPK